MQQLKDKQQFQDFISTKSKTTKLVHFWAQWSAACNQLDELLVELKKEYGQTLEVARLDAEGLPELSAQYGITAVPTVVAFQNGAVVDKVEGYHPAKLKDLAVKSTFDAVPRAAAESNGKQTAAPKKAEEEKEDLNSRLKRLINKTRMTLFMKGSPDAPKCGFSRQIVEILHQHQVDFWTFDILCDEQVRQGLKEYSDWPTYPQLYLDGELLGGLDVIREEIKDPAFVEKLPKLHT